MRTARLTLLGLSILLLGACGVTPTAPDGPSDTGQAQNCGYLGSAGRC